MKNLDLSWQISRDERGDALLVTYKLRNRGDSSVLVLDRMIVFGQTEGYERSEDAIVARADAQDPTLLRLVRGRVAPYGRPMIELVPGVRALEPGAELSGSARVPLPLRSWHPNDRFRDLPAVPTRAVLEIGVLPGDTATDEWPMNDQGALRVPSPPAALVDQQIVRGEILPLP